MVHRRRFLLAALAAGSTATAGCLADDGPDDSTDDSTDDGPDDSDEGPDGPDDGTPPDLERRADGVYRVIPDGLGDASASVRNFGRIEYLGPVQARWSYDRIASSPASGDADASEDAGSSGGADASGAGDADPPVEVAPVIDTTDDVEHLFLAPGYDADADRWSIHAYADETYYEAREDHVVVLGRFLRAPEYREVETDDVGFTEYHDGIYRATVDYGGTPGEDEHPQQLRRAYVGDGGLDALLGEGAGGYVGAYVAPEGVGPTNPDFDRADQNDPAPVVDFSFDYDPDAETVTIAHEGGPAIRSENVRIGAESGLTGEQLGAEFAAGDRLTVEVPGADPGEYLVIDWRGLDSYHPIVLERFEFPA